MRIATKTCACLLTVVWFCSTAASMLNASEKKRPNVLFLFSDDQRRDTIGALGNEHIITPNLDRLVREGTVFTRNYCMGSMSGAVCGPSRIMVLTGRTLWRIEGNIFNMADRETPLWPGVMREAGYRTFGTGKWHNGRAWYQRGFTDGGAIFFGGMGSHTTLTVHDFDPTGKYGPEVRHKIEDFSSTSFANAAVEFLQDRDSDKPFFMYVSFTAPHDPRTPPKKYRDMYDAAKLPLPKNYLPKHPFNNGELVIRDEKLAPWPRTPEIVREHLADYYGMITHMDAQIGRILAALKKSGEYDNTIIVFAADHGLAVGSHGLLGKQNLYEHSTGAPLIIAGPGLPRGEKSDAMCYLLDIFPTVCDLVGLPIPQTVEGKSLAPILQGNKQKVRDSIYTAYRHIQRAVRTDRWKLIRYPQINKTQLFDLENDPDEIHDLAEDRRYHERIEELTTLLLDWQKRLGDGQPLSTDKPQPTVIELPPATKKRPQPKRSAAAKGK